MFIASRNNLHKLNSYYIFLFQISHTSFVILALLFASSLVASESWAAPTNSTYYRIWESEILRKDFPSLAQGSYTDLKLNITDDLQQEVELCIAALNKYILNVPQMYFYKKSYFLVLTSRSSAAECKTHPNGFTHQSNKSRCHVALKSLEFVKSN